MSRRLPLIIASCLALGGAETSIAQSNHGEGQLSCGFKGVVVIYSDAAELAAACDALNEVTAYFRAIGFEIVPAISLEFADRPADYTVPHGYFDAARAQVVVYRSAAVAPWGLSWNLALAASFLRHELVHVMVLRASKEPRRFPREWHEFIAYAIQLDLMDPNVLDRVLASRADVQPFDELLQVNEFTYGMGPEAFAVAAYKTYRARGGAQFVQQLLAGRIVPPLRHVPSKLECLWEKTGVLHDCLRYWKESTSDAAAVFQ